MSDFRSWNEAAESLACMSAEQIFKHWPAAPDAASNAYRDALGEWACEQILKARVPHAEAISVLAILAGAFVELLDALEFAAPQLRGRA